MKKSIRIAVGAILLISVVAIVILIMTGGSKGLSAKEKESISKIDATLLDDPQILELKKAKTLDNFIEDALEQREVIVEKYIDELESKLKIWELSPDIKVSELKSMAQEVLDTKWSKIEIGSKEFNDMVHMYTETDEMGTTKLAEEDHSFARLYIYMCIYNEYILSENATTSSLDNKTLMEVITKDAELNFASTHSRRILGEYLN